MKLLNVLLGDIRYQLKYGFYAAYAVICIVYIGALILLPQALVKQAFALIIFSDPAALGFFFVGGIVLLERDEALHSYVAILPVHDNWYIISKVLSLAAIALIVALAISIFALGGAVNYGLLSVAVLLGSALFTLLGIAVATRAQSINHYFLLSIPIGIALMAPALLSIFGVRHLLVDWLPATLLLNTIQASAGIGNQYNVWAMIVALMIWTALAYRLAQYCFRRYLAKVGG